MRKIMTADGSVTFHNERFNDTYHSVTVGAIEEAQKKYVEPACLQPGMRVLDFCFGLGYNTLAAMRVTHDLDVVGVESDAWILRKIQSIEVPASWRTDYDAVRAAARAASDCSAYSKGPLKIRILIEDGSTALRNLVQQKKRFSVIFFDPFSPKSCPGLWSEEVFRLCRELLFPDGRLTTYSCAGSVRRNMIAAGFSVIDGPRIGRRSPSTIAVRNGETFKYML